MSALFLLINLCRKVAQIESDQKQKQTFENSEILPCWHRNPISREWRAHLISFRCDYWPCFESQSVWDYGYLWCTTNRVGDSNLFKCLTSLLSPTMSDGTNETHIMVLCLKREGDTPVYTSLYRCGWTWVTQHYSTATWLPTGSNSSKLQVNETTIAQTNGC